MKLISKMTKYVLVLIAVVFSAKEFCASQPSIEFSQQEKQTVIERIEAHLSLYQKRETALKRLRSSDIVDILAKHSSSVGVPLKQNFNKMLDSHSMDDKAEKFDAYLDLVNTNEVLKKVHVDSSYKKRCPMVKQYRSNLSIYNKEMSWLEPLIKGLNIFF